MKTEWQTLHVTLTTTALEESRRTVRLRPLITHSALPRVHTETRRRTVVHTALRLHTVATETAGALWPAPTITSTVHGGACSAGSVVVVSLEERSTTTALVVETRRLDFTISRINASKTTQRRIVAPLVTETSVVGMFGRFVKFV